MRWTCTCAGNARSAGWESAKRWACWQSVSISACVVMKQWVIKTLQGKRNYRHLSSHWHHQHITVRGEPSSFILTRPIYLNWDIVCHLCHPTQRPQLLLLFLEQKQPNTTFGVASFHTSNKPAPSATFVVDFIVTLRSLSWLLRSQLWCLLNAAGTKEQKDPLGSRSSWIVQLWSILQYGRQRPAAAARTPAVGLLKIYYDMKNRSFDGSICCLHYI